jgi:hypothetical protein
MPAKRFVVEGNPTDNDRERADGGRAIEKKKRILKVDDVYVK